MSTWRHVGMTYLKYADLCATHVTNCLKEPRKSKALSSTAMHVRVTAWEGGKKGKPGARPPHRARAGGVPARRALLSRCRRGLVRSLTLVAAPPPPRRDCREGGGDRLADFLNAACVRGMPGRAGSVCSRGGAGRVSGVGEFEFFMFAHAFAFWSVALHTSRHTYNRRYTHTHTLLTLQTTHIYGSHGEPLAPVEGVPAAPRREHSRRAQRRGERAQREHKPNSNTNSRHSAQLSQIEARLHAVTTERSPPRRTACGCAPVGPHPTGRRSSRSSHRPRSASHLRSRGPRGGSRFAVAVAGVSWMHMHLLHGGVRCGW